MTSIDPDRHGREKGKGYDALRIRFNSSEMILSGMPGYFIRQDSMVDPS